MNSKEKTKFRARIPWKVFRQTLIYKNDCACQRCGTQYVGRRVKMLQIHHHNPLRYDDLTGDFSVLCASCHDQVEMFLRKKNWGKYQELWKALIYPFISNVDRAMIEEKLKKTVDKKQDL